MDMTITKLTNYNFDDFDLDFLVTSRRHVGLYGILLDYLLHTIYAGNYYAVWKSKEEKLKNCVIFVEKFYKYAAEIIYNLPVQHVSTSGPGSNIIAKYKNSNNGSSCYLDLNIHYITESHGHTKAQRNEKKSS